MERIADELLAALRLAGARGLTAAALRIEKSPSPAQKSKTAVKATPRKQALDALLAQGRVVASGTGAKQRFLPSATWPTAECVAKKLRELGSASERGLLWTKPELARLLEPEETPLSGAALKQLQSAGELVALHRGKTAFLAFTSPLRAQLGGAARQPAEAAPALDRSAISAAYRRAVRESGGFPDVKILTLQKGLGLAEPAPLCAALIGLWREGAATLSLGDWSLAGAEMRSAAVALDGERYLLVRMEDAV